MTVRASLVSSSRMQVPGRQFTQSPGSLADTERSPSASRFPGSSVSSGSSPCPAAPPLGSADCKPACESIALLGIHSASPEK